VERPGDGRLREAVGSSCSNTEGAIPSLQRSALLIAVAAVAAIAGCGGSGSPATSSAPDSAPATSGRHESKAEIRRYAERAEAICKHGIQKTRALTKRLPRVASSSTSFGDTIVIGLVKPGIRILAGEAAKLRNLQSAPASHDLYVYLGLFDPIVELGEQLQVVAEAGETRRAHEIELLIASLGDEQSTAARRFGFHSCAIGFTSALGGVQ
jgi:hypothetical protein